MLVIRGIIITIGLLLIWQFIVWAGHIAPYILPSPWFVFQTLFQDFGIIMSQAKATAIETVLGFLIGVGFGALAALIIAYFKSLSLWLLPILIVSQAIPTFAIAPILVVWLGYGIASKVAVAAIVIFFPVTSNFYDGLTRTPQIWLDLAKTMNASHWKTLWHVRIPAALPNFASGVKIAAVFAPVGAIVGEWVGSSQGLGYLMLNANARMQINMMFAALLVVIIITLLLYFIVTQVLKRIIVW
tara:strand:+ start:23408 stop:24136 length:729 start_codon:yes stop_codon:yes gene_type:complete